MSNPLKELSRKEWCLWIGSLLIVTISNLAGRQLDYLTLIAISFLASLILRCYVLFIMLWHMHPMILY